MPITATPPQKTAIPRSRKGDNPEAEELLVAEADALVGEVCPVAEEVPVAEAVPDAGEVAGIPAVTPMALVAAMAVALIEFEATTTPDGRADVKAVALKGFPARTQALISAARAVESSAGQLI